MKFFPMKKLNLNMLLISTHALSRDTDKLKHPSYIVYLLSATLL